MASSCACTGSPKQILGVFPFGTAASAQPSTVQNAVEADVQPSSTSPASAPSAQVQAEPVLSGPGIAGFPKGPPLRAGSRASAAWSLLIWCTSGSPPNAAPLNTPAVLWAQAGAAGQTRPSPRKGGGLFDIAGHLGLARQGGRGAIRFGRLQDRTQQELIPDRARPPVRQPFPEVPRMTADGLSSVQPALQGTAAAASPPTRMPAEVRC